MCEKTKFRLPINWLVIALILSLYILGYFFYPYLPERVPSHWNISGQVDGYSSRTFHVLFFPSMILALYVLMSFAPILDPRPENYKKFQGVYEGFRWVMVGFDSSICGYYSFCFRISYIHRSDSEILYWSFADIYWKLFWQDKTQLHFWHKDSLDPCQ